MALLVQIVVTDSFCCILLRHYYI